MTETERLITSNPLCCDVCAHPPEHEHGLYKCSCGKWTCEACWDERTGTVCADCSLVCERCEFLAGDHLEHCGSCCDNLCERCFGKLDVCEMCVYDPPSLTSDDPMDIAKDAELERAFIDNGTGAE